MPLPKVYFLELEIIYQWSVYNLFFMKLSLRKVHLTGVVVRTHSHQAIAGAKAEKIKEQAKKVKE